MSTDKDDIMSQGNETALLNVLMYLDIGDVNVQNGWNMDRILDELGTIYASPDGYEIYLE
ncbi:MAG: hypothetical protein GX660_09530, partial [Clostridiaceae bacterium]|nr:hypothetical protein [Clostridiaceae bacterium]